MVASVVGDTITKIMERMSSLCVFGDKFITITNRIKHHLSNIKGVPEHSGAATPTPAWITDVMDVITNLWDLLDDQELLADAAVLPKQSNITSFFSLCDRIPRRRSLLLQLERIEKRLQHIAVQSTELSRMNSTELTNSDVKDREREKIVGREVDKEVIMSQVLALTKVKGVVNVVTILGMQGIGKTTLAKLVCRDERVKTNFDLVIWIDGVYDASYAESIVKRMIHESVTKKKKKLEEKDEDLNLGEAISGSTFLLVLDDFQSENDKEWFRLLQMLTAAACSSGATVLVTTQNYLVHESSHSRFYHVMGLSEDDSWTLFQQIARGGGGGGPGESKIKNAQMKMVKKCRGVPLAIVTMARMLKFHEATTESDIDHLEEEFMQEMKLIYYNELPSWHLKQCFAYLSFIFTTTYVPLGTLIRHWMAEGFLGPINSNSNSNSSSPEQLQPEDRGLVCIQEFQRRSILNVTEFQVGRSFCGMNEQLMVELSRFVAGEGRFCFCTDDRDKNVKGTVRRVALTRDFDVSNGVPEFLDKNNKYLRTIVFLKPYSTGWSSRIPYEVRLSWSACEDIFCAFKSLRVLNLTDLGMNILPSSIGELKNLKYLDLSHNSMKKLPSSIGKLKRLQTLILSHCHQLRELPHELKHLVSLRHLEIEGCLHLTHMPSALKKLTNLQSLSHFVTRNTSNNHHHKHIRGLAELIHLNNLREKLEISHLERLKFKRSEQDGHAYLKEKQHLSFLHLQWNHDGEDNDGSNNHDQVSLAHLEPHPNLKKLCIKGYRGANFSRGSYPLKILINSFCTTAPCVNLFLCLTNSLY